jgi:hypothetical protein
MAKVRIETEYVKEKLEGISEKLTRVMKELKKQQTSGIRGNNIQIKKWTGLGKAKGRTALFSL